MNVAQRLRAFAGGEEAARQVREPRGLRVHERNVHELTAAGPVLALIARVQRRQNSDEGVYARRDVRHGRGKPNRGGCRVAGDGHESRLALGDDIVAAATRLGARMAVSADRGIDKARVHGVQRFGFDAGPLQRRHSRYVGDENVRRPQQAKQKPV